MNRIGGLTLRGSVVSFVALLLLGLLGGLVSAQPSSTIRRSTLRPLVKAPYKSHFVLPHNPVVRRFSADVNPKAISLQTSFNGRTGKITIVGVLGRAIATPVVAEIAGANKRQFSTLSWEYLSAASLPTGALIHPFQSAGMPEVPAVDVTIAIPETARNFRAAFSAESDQPFEQVFLPPAATRRDSISSERFYDQRIYSSPQAASQAIRISRTARFRRVRFITVSIPLASLGSGNAVVSARNSFSAELNFDVDAVPTVAQPDKALDPVFDAAYHAMVANPEDVARFALPFHPKRRAANSTRALVRGDAFDNSSITWIDPGAPYIKLTVTRTGLYRATLSELVARSGNNSISTWQPSSVRLINRGREVPLWIDTAGGKVNAVEFYGLRYPGIRDEYYNWDTDSNAYYLTTSANFPGSPLRYTQPNASGSGPVIDRATLRLHHERDSEYYGGDAAADESTTLHRYQWIAGERFVWKLMRNNNRTAHDQFVLPSLNSDTTGKFATLKVFVRGMSQQIAIPDTHTCRIELNSVRLSDAIFTDYNEDQIELQVPFGMLHAGNNTIDVRFPNDNQDAWYFDYYEVSLPCALSASSDSAIASGQWAYDVDAESNDHTLVLQSSSGAPILYDIDHAYRLPPSSNTGGQYRFALGGTNSVTHIVAATSSSYMQVDRISDLTGRWSAILDTSTGADYIVIVHPNFKSAATALALRRQSVDGLRTKVILTDDIYDAFGYGSNVPEALQHYLQYAYDHYSGAPPAFVTLFGDGTWDPKSSLAGTIHQTFVPTYGVPSSDYYFTADQGKGFPDSVITNMVISRISVETAQEADAAVRKIIDYESQPPADWNRSFLFIVGGNEGVEHATLHDFAYNWINTSDYGGLRLPPINARCSIIDRTDFSGPLDGTHIAEIQAAFQKGLSFVVFNGHGASFITDVVLPDVGTLRNKSTYPIFLTLSCRTGAFAEPNIISLNESYMRDASNGVIMSFGTTGYGETFYDFYMTSRIFHLMGVDTPTARFPGIGAHVINAPTLFTISKLVESVYSANLGLQDGQDNALFEYTILGDAALGFSLRPQAEFHAASEDVQLSAPDGAERSTFSVFDSVVHVRATLHNFGYAHTSPVIVSITDVFNGGSSSMRDTIAKLDSVGTLDVFIRLDTSLIGSHTLHIYIDSINQFAETNEHDNEAIVTFLVSGAYTLPFYPPEGARNMCELDGDSIRLSWLIPSLSDVESIDIEVDSTSSFSNPKLLGSFAATAEVFYSSLFTRTLFPKDAGGVVWWRTITHTRSGKTETSDVSSLSLKQDGEPPSMTYATNDQLSRTIVSGFAVDPIAGGLRLPLGQELRYDVEARGSDDQNVIDHLPTGQIILNEKLPAMYTTPFLQGQNDFIGVVLVRLSHDGTQVDTAFEFQNTNSGSDSLGRVLADSFASVVNRFEIGTRVIVLTNFQPVIPGFTTNPVVTTALQSLGSANGMNGLQYFGSYALIGRKGLVVGQAKEDMVPSGGTGVHLFDTTTITIEHGEARFPTTSVATSFGKLRWRIDSVGANTPISLLVLGVSRQTGVVDTVRTFNAAISQEADLSTVDAHTYDKLQVLLSASRDSISLVSPVVRSIELQYNFAPEFLLDPSRATMTPTTTIEGLNTIAHYTCENLTCVSARNIPVILVRNFNGKFDTIATHNIPTLDAHTSVSFSDTLSTFGLIGKVSYIATVNPGRTQLEQIEFNNSATLGLTVTRDSLKPVIDLLFDDHHINTGDHVSSHVLLNARLIDANPVRVSDSGAIGMLLIQIDPPVTTPWTFKGGQPTAGFSTSFTTSPSGSVQANLLTSRDSGLRPGTYDLSAWGIDASGNKTDTIDFEFVVSDKNSLDEVMNYPNPFKEKTWFTYRLAAAGQSEVKVVIYTIAGRKIRTLIQGAAGQRVGLNAIEWDGRDESGNEIGNGTYLYKLILSGTNEDGSSVSQSVLERAVKSR